MGWKAFDIESELVLIEKISVGEIPCLRIRPRGAKGKLPTVIYYHGWHSSKEFQKFKGTALSIYGYQVIVPDAIYHGERNPIDHDEPGALDKYIWEVILQNTEESTYLIENVINSFDADPNKIGVIGSSMGGFSAAGAFIKNTSLRALVNMNGSCGWVNTQELLRSFDNSPPISKEEVKRLSKYDPMYNKERLERRPILILHGDMDSSIPIDSQRLFYKEVAPLYSENPEKLRFVEIPKMNHYISIGMLEEAIEWFEKYL